MLHLILAVLLQAAPAPTPETRTYQLVPVEDIADSVARDLFFLGGGFSFDTGMTALALRNPNIVEGNPLGFNSEARLALKVATTSAAALTCYKLRRGGHKTSARIVRWTMFAIQVAAGANNIYQATRGKGR